MKEKKSMLVTYVVDLNILSSFLIILSLFPKFTENLGIYFQPTTNFLDVIIRVSMIITLAIISWGYLRLKTWSFWLMITYHLFFLALSVILLLNQNGQLYGIQNLILSISGLIITLPTKRYFADKS